jgi:RND family efflux transporter MFP subunit
MRCRTVFRFRLLAALGLGLSALSLPGALSAQQAAPPAPPPVTVAQPIERTVAEWDEFTGRFEAVDTVEIRARVSGYLTEVHFTDGQMVKAGDLLFVIDARPFQRTVERLRADLAAARARFEFAQKDYERARPLAKNENISEQVFQQRQRELAETEASVQASQAALASAELDLEFTRITAPIAGRIGRRLVSVGNYVTGATETAARLTSIVSQDPVQFYFDMSEADYLKYLRLGKAGTGSNYRENPTPVFLGLQDEKDFPHPGALDYIDNRIDQTTGALRGRAVFKNEKGLFTPGLFARIRLAGSGEYKALMLPDNAIAADQTNRFVYTVADDGSVAAKPVTLGPIIDGLRVVRSGVTAEDWVIVNGIQRARPGGKVTREYSRLGSPSQAALK